MTHWSEKFCYNQIAGKNQIPPNSTIILKIVRAPFNFRSVTWNTQNRPMYAQNWPKISKKYPKIRAKILLNTAKTFLQTSPQKSKISKNHENQSILLMLPLPDASWCFPGEGEGEVNLTWAEKIFDFRRNFCIFLTFSLFLYVKQP